MIKNCPMRHENGNCLPAGGFCTANKDICEALHNAYELGRESQSEIIHCKDCIEFRRWIDTDIEFCDRTENRVSENDFCSMAERRTDGKTT